jgi:uroporphyrinogen-III synthase
MILLTRPLAQSENLQSLLNGLELDYELFPAFEINKINTKTTGQQYDVIIFISTNAVKYAEEYFKELFIKPFKVFAVGSITAKELIDKGIQVDCYPKNNASSNELLAMPDCEELKNKKILIVRGRGGSETLKNSLQLMNQVDYLEVYERTPCELTSHHIESIERFLGSPDGTVIANSIESLSNIIQLVKDVSFSHFDKLKSRNLIVLSERIKVQAKMIGFKNIRVTLNPSDQAVVDELINEKNKKTSQK